MKLSSFSGSEPRLLVASNRLPVLLRSEGGHWRAEPSSGGLVTALEPVLRSRGGTWVGWPGVLEGEVEDLPGLLAKENRDTPYRLEPVELSAHERRDFYEGFSNEVLWPLFHGFIGLCRCMGRFWSAYREVNKKFATRIVRARRPGDLIWVHDYHLMTVGQQLRRLGATNTVGFFLHIPFPAVEHFARLPWARQLLDGLLAYDLIGFQTQRDLSNFLDAVRRLRSRESRVLPDVVLSRRYPARPTRVGVHPISIDNRIFRERARTEEVRLRAEELRTRLGVERVLLGVDRLDYAKGVPEKLAAYERLLGRHPELVEKITLVQLVIPSRLGIRGYAETKKRIEDQVLRIVERFAEGSWRPIRYEFGSWSQDELLSWYRAADVGLVTSLRDGMNLVSKEYVAASVERGALVLSEFAGSAVELGGGALLVDPRDVDGSASAIHRALTLDPTERRVRMDLMQARVLEHDLHRWVRGFLAHVRAEASEVQAEPALASWLAEWSPGPSGSIVPRLVRGGRSGARPRPGASALSSGERPSAPPT